MYMLFTGGTDPVAIPFSIDNQVAVVGRHERTNTFSSSPWHHHELHLLRSFCFERCAPMSGHDKGTG